MRIPPTTYWRFIGFSRWCNVYPQKAPESLQNRALDCVSRASHWFFKWKHQGYMCRVVCVLWSTRNTICDGRLPVRLSDILGPAPYAVETFSEAADSPSKECRANLLKYVPLTQAKRGWPRRLQRPRAESATSSEGKRKIPKMIMSRVPQDHC